MSKPVSYAILGPGTVAEFHRDALAANRELGAELVAVVHHDPLRFPEFEQRFGVPCLTEAQMLARDDIDVVTICTPSGQHADQAVRAAGVGKHVLVEKPIATTRDDADRMIAACREADVRLGCVFQRRAVPFFRKIKRALEGGDLGTLTLGIVSLPYFRDQRYYDSGLWRGTWELDGGGVLMNQGIHILDLLLWYFGDVAAVRAFADTLVREIEVEDVALAAVRFASGALATITATTTAEPGFPHRLEIYGTHGGIQVEGEAAGRWSLASASPATVEPEIETRVATPGSAADPRALDLTGHTGILRDFTLAVREGRDPLVPGAEARRSLDLILRIYEAAEIRRPEASD